MDHKQSNCICMYMQQHCFDVSKEALCFLIHKLFSETKEEKNIQI